MFSDEIQNLLKEFADMKEALEGARIRLEEKSAALLSANKTVTSLLESIRTEKEKVEVKVAERTRELSEERARLIASLSNLPIGVVLSGLTHEIIFKNEAADKILGLSVRDANLGDVMRHFETKIGLTASVEETISRMIPITVDDLSFGNKFLRIFLSPIALLKNKEAVVGSVMLIEDISAAKTLERSKDEFLAIASHEMRTPLTIIKGNAELLLNSRTQSSAEENAKMLAAIHRNSARLMDIVNDFLDVISIDQGKLRLKQEHFDIASLLREVVADLKARAAEKNLYLKMDTLANSLPKVVADRGRAKEIVINFIANALQYTERGGITVTAEESGAFIKVLFTDTGIGIKPPLQAYLFQKLQAVGERFMHSHEYGSGLGLYINKRLAEAMGGTVALERSEVGVGSTFSMSLPIATGVKREDGGG